MAKSPVEFPVSVGVDEVASETRRVLGFTYFCLPDAYLEYFISQARSILEPSSLSAFHAKKYNGRKHTDLYLRFLELIREYSAKSLQTKALLLLLSDKFNEYAVGDLLKLVHKSCGPTGISPEDASAKAMPYLFPLVLFARSSNHLGDYISASYYFDRHSSYSDLKECPDSDAAPVSTGRLVEIIYNTIVRKKYPKSPSLLQDGVHVVSHHEQSFLVQAADVLGNFSLADMFVRLGLATPGRKAKSDLLREVFGDIIDNVNLGSLKVEGQDLVLSDEDAQVSFELKWCRIK